MKQKDECKQMAQNLINSICSMAGCDIPENNDEIVDFIVNDVEETADAENWHSGDVSIAFRRFLENYNSLNYPV